MEDVRVQLELLRAYITAFVEAIDAGKSFPALFSQAPPHSPPRSLVPKSSRQVSPGEAPTVQKPTEKLMAADGAPSSESKSGIFRTTTLFAGRMLNFGGIALGRSSTNSDLVAGTREVCMQCTSPESLEEVCAADPEFGAGLSLGTQTACAVSPAVSPQLISSLQPPRRHDLVSTLQTTNILQRAVKLERLCQHLLGERNFAELEKSLSTLSSFGRLESIVQVDPSSYTLLSHYKSAEACVRKVLSECSDAFDIAIRSDRMENAVHLLATVRNMLVLAEHIESVEDVHWRLNAAFQQKTSQFAATVNSLLECKNFKELASLINRHRELQHELPTAQHEVDSATVQLADFFKLRLENTWTAIQSISSTTPLADQRLNEMSDVMKDF